MNLQYFAEEDGEQVPVVEEPVIESEPSEKIEEIAEPQSREDNAKFAEVRRKAEAKAKEESERVKRDYESKLAKMETLTGMKFDEALTYLEEQTQLKKAKEMAEANNLPEDYALEQVKEKDRTMRIEMELNQIKAMTRYESEKALLKEKPFFNDLEADIETLVKSEATQGRTVNAETAYRYLLGQNYEKLIDNAQKSAVANIQDRAKRGLPLNNSDSEPVQNEPQVNKRMANIFGTDPSKIAKYVKDQLKK